MHGVPGKHVELSSHIIKSFYAVYHALGEGLGEKVHHAALFHELKLAGMEVQSEAAIPVYYRGVVISTFSADLVVNDLVILELKAVAELYDAHGTQRVNYLKAARYEVGLLLNSGPKPQIVRKVFDNNYEGSLNWLASDGNSFQNVRRIP